jgi:WD40 repeat protein
VSNNVTQKINALLDAFDSDEGIDLIIQALSDPVREVRETACWLLTETNRETAEQALRCYPYAQMQHLHTITGYSEKEPGYFAISTDQKALLSNCHSEAKKGYAYATVKIWNLRTGELTHTLPFTHEHLSTGQNGQIIVGHFQQIIDVRKSWEIKRLPLTLYGSIDIGSLAVSSDGSIIVCGELGPRPLGQIAVWNVETGKLIHTIQWQPATGSSNISTVMISPDTSLLLSQDKQRYGDLHRLWNLQTGELIRAFETYPY